MWCPSLVAAGVLRSAGLVRYVWRQAWFGWVRLAPSHCSRTAAELLFLPGFRAQAKAATRCFQKKSDHSNFQMLYFRACGLQLKPCMVTFFEPPKIAVCRSSTTRLSPATRLPPAACLSPPPACRRSARPPEVGDVVTLMVEMRLGMSARGRGCGEGCVPRGRGCGVTYGWNEVGDVS